MVHCLMVEVKLENSKSISIEALSPIEWALTDLFFATVVGEGPFAIFENSLYFATPTPTP
jgi:hypothetical protein